jgi:hypothetical protein
MDLALGLQLPAWPAHFVSGNSEASYEFTWVNGQILTKPGLLIQQHEWVSNTIFSWRMFSENFRQVLLSSIELELNLNSNPCEGLSYYDTFCFAEILSSKIIFSEMNDYFNNLPYFFAAISFPLFLHNHCLAAQLK